MSNIPQHSHRKFSPDTTMGNCSFFYHQALTLPASELVATNAICWCRFAPAVIPKNCYRFSDTSCVELFEMFTIVDQGVQSARFDWRHTRHTLVSCEVPRRNEAESSVNQLLLKITARFARTTKHHASSKLATSRCVLSAQFTES